MNRYAIPIFFVLVSVGIYIKYIDPAYAEISAGRSKVAEYTAALKDAKEAQTKIDALKDVQANFPAGYEQALLTIIPNSIDSTRLIIDVDGIAQMRGLHIKGPAVGEKGTENGYVKHTLSFSVTAPYAVFRSFLRDLESSLALRDAASVSFSSSATADDLSKSKSPEFQAYDYNIMIITYSHG